MPKPKRPQSTSDLEQQLAIQLGSLERNCGAYDEGAEDAILDIATRLRVLLHDTAMSLSLLGQLGIKTSLQFYDLSLTIPDLDPRLQMGETILAWTTTFPTPRYVAILDHGPPPKKLSFGEWWEASCLMMHPAGQKLGRKELILTVSNQDGGAHVDSGIDEDYAFFKDDAVIHMYRKGNGEFKPIPGKTGASVRQVAHEVLKSLKPGYEKMHRPEVAQSMCGPVYPILAPDAPGVTFGTDTPCPCGSGLIFKVCHGRSD